MKISDVTPELVRRMASVEDQRFYAAQAGIAIHQDDITAPDNKPQPKVQDKLEKVQQGEFADWLYGEKIPYCWHRTDKKSTGTVGCPDFIVGVSQVTLWIEFKREGYKLSPDQEIFRTLLEGQGIWMHIVYSSHQAINLIKAYRQPKAFEALS